MKIRNLKNHFLFPIFKKIIAETGFVNDNMIRGGLMRLDNLLDDMDSSRVNRVTINHLAEALNLTKGPVS